MANATTTLLEGIKSHKLQVTNSITITNACYGAMFGFIFILISQGKLGPLELFLTSSKSSHELNGGNVKIEVRERERGELFPRGIGRGDSDSSTVLVQQVETGLLGEVKMIVC